ncbi:nicotinate-nucleotide adenylyltransferase [Demequina lignilytica]|uniref:Probable nicotinate-nucleotide adenylyltransferase n=1 Tax=Demequina lignilytica TaxID=3051663 RepID=A0AAW7M188_9MICO|nr:MULTISPECIES: nicotinate-nucleotide adenylyltransferase [unclassified Demequina]MDN4478374.1 nicotinate-nucleotide adenylyltransferase [Demequina sp. SYSU T00039-1]MDN4482466.1 nicotinate-nucleotide adenylyltransferase [Demequina sp. SYSU T0a273]MDN4487119.1 nicotinate-nucleotide adenylyltransferase [Demequina sp. SYSU T00039]MDN4489830.1 nicotinate-nucleotide adenylyltransferase [Demequina sp. SYSU T00068]
MTGERIGVLGGTFDPVHLGHLAAASEVCDRLGLDRVLLVPTAAQPFKVDEPAAPSAHRLAMCELAASGDPRLGVSTVDLDRGGVTYTVDTLADLHALHPDAELFFITGADALARLDEWKDADKLLESATFVGVTRPGHALDQSDRPHILVEAPALAISSTDVRRRVRAGRTIRYLVPHGVADYIAANGLYDGGIDD